MTICVAKTMSPLVLLAAWLLSSATLAATSDCRECHSGKDPKAKNYLEIYANPGAHHPVEVPYPPVGKQSTYELPTGQVGDVGFFDANRNGIPDADEIQIFNGRMECASCHDPAHGTETSSAKPQANPLYLRKSNRGSEICVICHRL